MNCMFAISKFFNCYCQGVFAVTHFNTYMWCVWCWCYCIVFKDSRQSLPSFEVLVVISLKLVSQKTATVWLLHSCRPQTVRTGQPSLCRVTKTRVRTTTTWRYCAPLCTCTPSLPSSLSGAGSVKVSKAARALSPPLSTSVIRRKSRAHWPIRRLQANSWTASKILGLLWYC